MPLHLHGHDLHRHRLHHLHDGHPFDAWLAVHTRLDPEELERHGAPPAIRRLVFACLVVLSSLVSIDVTIVNVALPSILGDLGGGVETVQWIASVYALAYAVFLIPGGRLGDVIGHRRVFLLGGALYVAASVGAALAPSAVVLILARALQGVGAGMISPSAIALMARVFTSDRRNVAFGVLAASLAVVAGLGPLVGGILTDTLGWRAIFAVTAALAIFPLIGMAIVPRTVDRPPSERFDPDLGGIALLAIAVATIQIALVESGRLGWWPFGIVALGVGIGVGYLTIVYDRRRAEPLIDADVFRSRIVVGSLVAKFLSSFGFYGVILYVVLFLEGTVGLSAIEVGLVLLVPAVTGVAISPIVGKVLTPRTVRPLIVGGIVLEASGILILAALESASSVAAHVIPGLFLNAVGFSMVSVPTKVAPLDDVPTRLYGRISALISTVGKLAAGFGVAASAALFHVYAPGRADNELDSEGLRPPLTVENVQDCLGVNDVQACVDDLVKASSSIAGVRDETVAVITSTFEATLASTLFTIGAITLAASALVWRLLRPRAEPLATPSEQASQ